MGRQTSAQKHARFASFFLALARPPFAQRMRTVGFTRQHWDKAWALVGDSVDARLALFAEPARSLDELFELERKWMPIVKTTLEMNYPALHDELMGNYQRVTGPVLLPVMQEVIARLERLGLSLDPVRQQARALLADRGFTSELVAEIERAIAEALTIPHAPEEAEDRVAEADGAMWAYYLEWSRIARAVMPERSLLRQLGFLRNKRGRLAETPIAAPTPATPAPATLAHAELEEVEWVGA